MTTVDACLFYSTGSQRNGLLGCVEMREARGSISLFSKHRMTFVGASALSLSLGFSSDK